MTLPFNNSTLRPLTDAEVERIVGGQEQEIVVVGRRYSGYGGSCLGYAEYGTGVEPHPTLSPDGGGGDTSLSPPDLGCSDTSMMTPEELRDYRISQEAARVAKEIMGKSDKDHYEYGAWIYRDTDGSIKHTPLTRGGPDSVTPTMFGTQNYGQILGLVHSHTADKYDDRVHTFKMFPTPNTVARDGQGDWYAFDQTVSNIESSLQADHGLSSTDAAAEALNFRQYIVGPSGPAGTSQYELHGYDTNDRDTTTLGQKINLDLGNCPG